MPEAYEAVAAELIWEMCWSWSVRLPSIYKRTPSLYLALLKRFFPMLYE